MINKKNIWFLTLFSLVLVLSVYYITMPNDILLESSKTVSGVTTEVSEVSENAALVALRVEKEEKVLEEMENLNNILTDVSKSVEEKNDAYEKMKNLNEVKGEEESLEKKVKDTFNLNSVVTVDGDTIKVVASGSDSNTSLANNIMRTIQDGYDNKMYISVKFENN
ncbi:MAG: SpoIIIAH-like family protein [Bacilli bacterium]|nr:SpoIIIAH-like family protein [Bacilli bacterium]